MNRVGVTGAWGYVERNFYPDSNRTPVAAPLPRSFRSPRAAAIEFAGGNEFVEVAGVRMASTRQGFLRVDYRGVRALGGPALQTRAAAGCSARCSLSLAGARTAASAAATRSSTTPSNPFQGWSRDFNVGTTLQPSGRLSQTHRLSARRIRPCRHARARLHARHRQHAHDVSVHARVRASRHRAVRQLTPARAHRLPRVVRAAARARSSTPGTGRCSSSATSSTANGCPESGNIAPRSAGCSSRRRTCTGSDARARP